MDIKKRRARVTAVTPPGFVQFEFSIGSLDLSVDLILPRAAFDEFCRSNKVELVDTGCCLLESRGIIRKGG